MNSTGFFEPPKYNLDGRQQLWVDGILNSHDVWCGCDSPIAHLLNHLLPPGHKDRKLTVDQLINQAYKQKCHFGGEEETGGTSHVHTATEEEDGQKEDPEGDYTGEEIELLLAAAAADEGPR